MVSFLAHRLLYFNNKCFVKHRHGLAQSIMVPSHFLGYYKNQAEELFRKGLDMYGKTKYKEALHLWAKSALLHHVTSHAHISQLLCEGRDGVPKDKKLAFEFASAGALLGCKHSMAILGSFYILGFRVKRDVVKGLDLVKDSVAAGSSFGQFWFGFCYERGTNIAKDIDKAKELYSLAAAQGHASAQFRLGCIFDSLRIAGKDAEAFRLYGLAAEQGLADAQYNLGLFYQFGVIVDEDYDKALHLYQLAEKQGHEFAKKLVKELLEEKASMAQNES
jgi:TPR repeat protein